MTLASPANKSNTVYYHVNRKGVHLSPPMMKPGDRLEIGAASNPYFRHFETQGLYVLMRDPNGAETRIPPLKFISMVATGKAAHPNIAEVAGGTAAHFMRCGRELIWEQVRQNSFSALPSRQRCIFLVPTLEEAKYWVERLGCGPAYQIVRLNVYGQHHMGDGHLLTTDSEPLLESVTKATKYWSGQMTDHPELEHLFVGQVEVLDVVESGTASW